MAINIETGKHEINTGGHVMSNIVSSKIIDDKLQYEPSMVIVGWLPIVVVAWALALLSYFILS